VPSIDHWANTSNSNTIYSYSSPTAERGRNVKVDSQMSLSLCPALPESTSAECPPGEPESMGTDASVSMAKDPQTQSFGSVSLPVAREHHPHAHWSKSGKRRTSRRISRASVSVAAVPKDVTTELNESSLRRHCAACWVCFPLQPGGHFRYYWDILSILFILHDALVLPLYFFELQKHHGVQSLAWCARIFWMADIAMNMLTGYYEMGILVDDLRRIFCRYMRTWLLLDTLCVAEDWLLFSNVGEADPAREFLSLLRVIRLLKLRKMSGQLHDQMQSQAASIQFNLLGTLTGLVIINHIIACCWYGISQLGDGGETWLKLQGWEDAGPTFHYVTSYYWAFSQLGVGNTEIHCVSLLEYVFASFVAMASLLIFSTLVSTMTSLMTTLNEIQESEISQFRALRRFLAANHIPQELSTRIMQFVQHSYPQKSQESDQDGDLAILDMLSSPLKAELRFARFAEKLDALPFLRKLMGCNDLQITRLTHQLAGHLDLLLVAPGDVVFFADNEAKTTYVNLHGSLKYYQASHSEEVTDGIWLSEMCLWTSWEFMGTLVAEEVSRLVSLNEEIFKKTICESAVAQQMASSYAVQYVSELTSQKVVSDLWVYIEPGHQAAPAITVSEASPGVPRSHLLSVVGRLSCGSRDSGGDERKVVPVVPSESSVSASA